jgi:hypothetical protein
MHLGQEVAMAQATTEFFGDEALENRADDALGYAPFAEKLAEALIRLKPKSGSGS